MRSSSPSGRFTVTGPYEDDHPVPSVSAGISCAQTFCTRHRKQAEELTYYVRDLASDTVLAMVTKESDGSITTRSHSILDPNWTPQAGYSHAERLAAL